MGYRLTIQLSKAGNDHSCDGSKVTEDTKEGISMAVEIQEKKATLEISRSNDGYTECQKFNFKLPVSGDYEIEFSEIILDSDEYTKLYTSGINVRYSQGVLYLNIERTDEEGFCFEVKDAKHYYKAMRYYKNMEQHIEVEGIEVHITEDKPEGEGK
jgi:hypothetical protein